MFCQLSSICSWKLLALCRQSQVPPPQSYLSEQILHRHSRSFAFSLSALRFNYIMLQVSQVTIYVHNDSRDQKDHCWRTGTSTFTQLLRALPLFVSMLPAPAGFNRRKTHGFRSFSHSVRSLRYLTPRTDIRQQFATLSSVRTANSRPSNIY